MALPATNLVQPIRDTHAADSKSCGATSENFREPPNPDDRKVPVAPRPAEVPLTPQQCLAIGHLLAGQSYTRTAELVRIDPRTLYEWRRNPAFIARMNELCQETLEAVAMRTRNLLLRGTERLERSVEGTIMFGDVLRVVSNKRIWEMAHVLPREVGGEVNSGNEQSKEA